ncbi:MAG: LEPR-XLL domain-containing protein, partial [Deltaproteobacteria bacterium]|nr:LEPR-XLL domain-containing protein [Deltaproteobacteria bacterium]
MLDLFTKIAEKFKALSRKDPTRDSVHRRKIQFETLEKRVLLSADLGVDFQNFQEAPDLKPDTVSTLVDRDGRFEESEILDASNPETESENSLLSEDA